MSQNLKKRLYWRMLQKKLDIGSKLLVRLIRSAQPDDIPRENETDLSKWFSMVNQYFHMR